MRKIRAIVFDVDGTLLDTREYIAQAYEHSLNAHGFPVPSREEVVRAATGTPLPQVYPILAPNGDVIALRDTHREFQMKRLDLITAYSGLYDVLDKLRADGVLLGVCSARGPTVRPSLEHVRILKHFDAVIDATEVENHKPHPEGVLKVLELLHVAPGESAMIGDTASDIEAGKAAGCALTIGITHGFGTREMLETAEADIIVDSLHEIPALL